MIDLGTGDGRFVSISAARNPENFFIGIDANVKPLHKPSMRATRKPSKGGLPNALFVQAAVENLPCELNGIASEVYVNFPWGSLLSGTANGEDWLTDSLRRVCTQSAHVTIVLGIDETRDRTELERLGIPPLSDGYLRDILLPKYEAAGFAIVEQKTNTQIRPDVNTSWARRLSGSRSRKMLYIVLEAR